MMRDLCIELTDIRGGIERSVSVNVNFIGEGFSRPSKSKFINFAFTHAGTGMMLKSVSLEFIDNGLF